jgi:hypothetical protein
MLLIYETRDYKIIASVREMRHLSQKNRNLGNWLSGLEGLCEELFRANCDQSPYTSRFSL